MICLPLTTLLSSSLTVVIGDISLTLSLFNTLQPTIGTGTLSIANTSGLQAALDAKANLSGCTFTGTVNGVTKAMVSLGKCDNTSDVNKPVSTATQTALNLKLNTASPNYTGALANSGISFIVDASGNLTALSLSTGGANIGTAVTNTPTEAYQFEQHQQ